MFRLDVGLDSWETVGIWRPELVQSFGVPTDGDVIGSGKVACVDLASWPGVVDAGFVTIEDHVVARLRPLLGPIALVERLAGGWVREAFNIDLVGNGTLAAGQAGHDDCIAIGGPRGGPAYVGNLMGGSCQRRSEVINEGRCGYGGVWGAASHEVPVFPMSVIAFREWVD